MAKKNQEVLIQLQEAISKIKQIKEQKAGKNPQLDEALSHAEKYLFNKLYEELSISIGVNKKTKKGGSP